nr:MAG TPA: hypothetical protein [Caudoviricetes sp.]
MTIFEFETFIKETRKEFRELITIYLNGEVGEMKKLIKDKLNECQSDFEVNVLKENLQEEFGLYLDELKGE